MPNLGAPWGLQRPRPDACRAAGCLGGTTRAGSVVPDTSLRRGCRAARCRPGQRPQPLSGPAARPARPPCSPALTPSASPLPALDQVSPQLLAPPWEFTPWRGRGCLPREETLSHMQPDLPHPAPTPALGTVQALVSLTVCDFCCWRGRGGHRWTSSGREGPGASVLWGPEGTPTLCARPCSLPHEAL